MENLNYKAHMCGSIYIIMDIWKLSMSIDLVNTSELNPNSYKICLPNSRIGWPLWCNHLWWEAYVLTEVPLISRGDISASGSQNLSDLTPFKVISLYSEHEITGDTK